MMFYVISDEHRFGVFQRTDDCLHLLRYFQPLASILDHFDDCREVAVRSYNLWWRIGQHGKRYPGQDSKSGRLAH
jgi:hypothetical protein